MKRLIAALSAGFVLALVAGVATANAGPVLSGQEATPSMTEGAGPSGGNVAKDSIGTVQVNGVSADVAADVSSDLLDTSVDADAPLSIGGSGGNSAEDTIGTVQLGGGNTAKDSIGTVQSGPISGNPTLDASTDLLDTDLQAGVPLSVGGNGGNSVGNSIGTVQLGGGNRASDSIGTVQSGPISIAPWADLESDVLDAAVDAPVAIGGNGGNSAEGSIGTVQLGGGNRAEGSIGTVQSGPISLDPSVNLGELVDADVEAPIQIGGSGSGGNTAEGSIGTVQVGGGNVAEGSIGTIQVGGGGGTGPQPPTTPPGQGPPPGHESPGHRAPPGSGPAPGPTDGPVRIPDGSDAGSQSGRQGASTRSLGHVAEGDTEGRQSVGAGLETGRAPARAVTASFVSPAAATGTLPLTGLSLLLQLLGALTFLLSGLAVRRLGAGARD